ncbi:MAG: SurA N-terminal domain-containing protein [Elusimicrobiota bacterium]|jgi:hypothetical protein|nr:SurA N-terminal domain-containing protein [Elusimicrobiota bacterium]
MVSFMIKYKNILLILTVLFFIGSLGFVGANVFMDEYGPNTAIAYVGDAKIKFKHFESAYRAAERRQREAGPSDTEEETAADDAAKKLKQEVLQAMITEESLAQSARKYGIGVPDLEIAYDIKNTFSDNGLFNKKAYVWVVRNQLGMNPEQYEAALLKQKMANKFQNALILSAKITPQETEFMLPKTEESKPKKGTKRQTLPKPDSEATAIVLTQIKAQSLADSFTRQFNAQERVELKHQDKI